MISRRPSGLWLSSNEPGCDSPTRCSSPMSSHVALWTSWFDLWHSSLCRFMRAENGGARHAAISAPQDPRFKHPAWSENPYFDFLRQSYLITSRWADTLVNEVEDLDPHTRNKARFYMT